MEHRRNFWDKHHTVKFQGGSNPFPIGVVPGWKQYIRDKSILEIGPGEGRQTDTLLPFAKNYAIADISAKALAHFDIKDKYLIKSYNDNFNKKFDVIVLFYVFHHVLNEELEYFLKFLIRHLKPKGYICFNIPEDTHYNDNADGTTTSKYIYNEFKILLKKYKLNIIEEKNQEANNYLFIVQGE